METRLQDIRDKAVPILKQAGVRRSSVFGSVARREETLGSDIDMLVEFPRGKSLLDLVELKMRLEEVLQVKVDVLTYRSLSPFLVDIIKRDEVQIL